MKNLKVDSTMFSFMAFIFVIILLGYVLAPSNIGAMVILVHILTLLCVTGLISFFLLRKGKFFRNGFLFAYFGIIACLIFFNVNTIISKDYENLLVKIVIILSLVAFFIYPFRMQKND